MKLYNQTDSHMAPEGVIKASLLEVKIWYAIRYLKKFTFKGEDCINKLAENISHNEDSPFTITDLRDIRYKVNDQLFFVNL